MEINEAEKVVIAKPVPCKPKISSAKSITDHHLFSPINAPQLNSSSKGSLIRPTTGRSRPRVHNDVVPGVLNSETGPPLNKVEGSDAGSNAHVVYKPIAKLVSKRTIHLLEHLVTNRTGANRENRIENNTEPTADFNQISNTEPESNRDAIPEVHEDNRRLTSLPPNNNVDRHNDASSWRKYGQKHVKGSQYPRSYYKCTYPNCPVKKKVEKTTDGQIAEIVYKGEHNHSNPKDNLAVDGQTQELVCEATRHEDNLNRTDQINIESATLSSCLGLNGEYQELNESIEAESDDFRTKRRKCENKLLKTSTMEEGSSEPRFVIKKNTDFDKVGDGYRWRKYGQKVVKGNSYPRSYYRCTSAKCNVRKYIERTSEDPGSFITTYEGRHNHDMPSKSPSKE